MNLFCRQVSVFKPYTVFLCMLLWMATLSSCIVTRKPPTDKPFVYKTHIALKGSFTNAARQELVSKLMNQLDDSLKTRYISIVGIQVLIKPPSFDSANIGRSKVFMDALLNSLGYFYPNIKDSFNISGPLGKKKANIFFDVNPGKQTRFDTVGYELNTPELQLLALQSTNKQLIKAGQPYSIGLVAQERDRLISVFHDSGYYRIGLDDIYAEVDTVVSALIDPTLDEFEQLRLLDSLRKKSENPTIHVVFKQRPEAEQNHLKQFYIGNVHVYPDQNLLQDSALQYKKDSVGPFRFFTTTNKFLLPFVAGNIFMMPGQRYSQFDYFKTINTFNRLGAWQSSEVSLSERYDSLPYVDADIRLFPALKQNLKIDLEASRNIADYLTTSQFFGLGLNFALTNRNAFKRSIQTNTNSRFGVEFGSNFIQTLQTNLSHSIQFPGLLLPFQLKTSTVRSLTNDRTILNMNGSYTVRREIYNVRSFNTSWGYEWTKGKINWQFIPINVEYTLLDGKDSLRKLINQIPSLRYAFNDGFVIGMSGGFNTSWNRKNRTSFFKVRIEESGSLFGLIRKLEENNLFRFIKTDVEYKHLISKTHSQLAFRVFGGVGFVYGTKNGQSETNLPFFKAYFSGGPYSMRAWQVRRLGPGSSLLYDTTGNQLNDRFGNMQLEANVEYRFDLTTIAGIKVKSALFADMGNIWGNEFKDANATQKIEEASFKPSRLYRDLALAGGTSLRFDFDFFLIRLDWAYKLKDPRYADINGGWFHNINLLKGQFQLGINYPF